MARQTVAVSGLREMLKANTKAEKQHSARGSPRLPRRRRRHPPRRPNQLLESQLPVGGRLQNQGRQRGIAVEQSIRKTTGDHPEYGALQMRHLIRAQHDNEDDLDRELERAMAKISRAYERRP